MPLMGPTTVDDFIRINDLLLIVSLASGAHWPQAYNEPVSQPVLISLSIPCDVKRTASTDNLAFSVDYAVLCDRIRESLGADAVFESLERLSARIYDIVLDVESPFRIDQLCLRVAQTKAALHCKSTGVESAAAMGSNGTSWKINQVRQFFEDIDCHVIIGVNPAERSERQVVRVNISIEQSPGTLERARWVDFRGVTKLVIETAVQTSFLTLEAFTSNIAQVVLGHLWYQQNGFSAPVVTVKAAKPSAVVFASSAEVEIRRRFDDYPDECTESDTSPGVHIATLALGSNLGDRFHNIELALRLLEASQELLDLDDESLGPSIVTVIDTSFMYETAPMYVTEQPAFINCACIIETNLPPTTLLHLLKKIESTVGRVPSIRNGPRAIDLDIILYDHDIIDTRPHTERKDLENLHGQLVVPHPRMGEREFVLRPLNDMIPDYIHPVYRKSIETLLGELALPPDDPPMEKVIPFPQYPLAADHTWAYPSVYPVPPTLTYWITPSPTSKTKAKGTARARKTHLMATLNTTPDSFSDGGAHNTLDTAFLYAQEAVEAGATIIDVGGCSTRPGAAFVSVEEEIERVVPVVGAIRKHSHAEEGIERLTRQVPISVDTFRPEVAEAAIKAGVNCINDVYAFAGPEPWSPLGDLGEEAQQCMGAMKKVARDFAVPVVLMHSRGEAGKNKDYGMYKYAGGGGAVVEGVRVELGEKVERIVKGKGGVRRWFVIADPGVGFSKTVDGNLKVLRDAANVTANVKIGDVGKRRRNPLAGYPSLIGVSRKSFLGAILSVGDQGRNTSPKERTWATATGVVCAVQQGAMVVRVHDTKEMADVVRIADALWGCI